MAFNNLKFIYILESFTEHCWTVSSIYLRWLAQIRKAKIHLINTSNLREDFFLDSFSIFPSISRRQRHKNLTDSCDCAGLCDHHCGHYVAGCHHKKAHVWPEGGGFFNWRYLPLEPNSHSKTWQPSGAHQWKLQDKYWLIMQSQELSSFLLCYFKRFINASTF